MAFRSFCGRRFGELPASLLGPIRIRLDACRWFKISSHTPLPSDALLPWAFDIPITQAYSRSHENVLSITNTGSGDSSRLRRTKDWSTTYIAIGEGLGEAPQGMELRRVL